MANTDFIQATMEIFAAIITVVSAVCFSMIIGNKNKSERNLLNILGMSGLLLILDAGWYIYDGNITELGFAMNWLCNFALFVCNPILVVFVNKYVCNMITENGNNPNRVISTTVYVLSLIAILIPLSNLGFRWMYYFDELNVYHRLTGWYIYTVVNSLSILMCAVLVFAHRHQITPIRRIALIVFFVAPFFGIALQALQIGISFIQLGTAIASFFIVASYIYEWIKTKNDGTKIFEEKKRIWLIESIFLIMILFISASIITCIISVKNVSNESSEQNSIALAYMVSGDIEGVFSEPVNVSRTMAQAEEIIDALSADKLENTDTEQKMLGFMNRVREKYGYQMIFVASEKTKAYYTYDGLSRYMDVSRKSQDSWYYDFKNSGAEYELNIDADKDNNMELAVFINVEVRDEDGNYLGACGVATSIESLVELFTQYEKDYGIDISLTNRNGLVQVNTDRSKIEKAYCDISPSINRSEVVYRRDNAKAIMSKYLSDYGWYLAIEDHSPDKLDVINLILPSLIIYAMGIAFIVIFFMEFRIRERHRSNELISSKLQSQAAKEESHAKGRFLANMSHEIRTPINAVLGMNTMILRESKEPQIREYAMIIQNSGNVLLSLVNDILDISKIESGKMEILPEEYNFSVLINDVINMLSLMASKKGLDVKLEIEPGLPTGLYGDDVRLRQIIVNIMNNAVKYTERGSVTLSASGEIIDNIVRLSISVKDTGIGIKEENIQKLFEDFTRIEESRNKRIEGTGLGVGITVQLLKLMNSKLEVESVYGEGSEFSFVIEQRVTDLTPIGDVALHIQEAAKNYEYVASFVAPDARVLVVDDNDINRIVFVNLLKETRVQVDDVDCGKKALELVYSQPYDIIFLDHMMPDMDGIEVLNRIKAKADHPNVNTPVIVLTANAIAGVKEEYLEAGFDDYLSKPIIPEQLETMISLLLPSDKVVANEGVPVEDNVNNKVETAELPMIDGVDWNYAKLHMSNHEALLNTLRSFVTSINYEADSLEALYNELMEDKYNQDKLELYRIKVHSMKSTATLLGCVPIAGMAATLENAAKCAKLDTVRDVTPYFINSWREYKNKLSFAIEANDDKKDVEDATLIRDYIVQLKDAIQEFDVDGADSVLKKLRQYNYETEIEEIIEQLVAAVNYLDTDEVLKLGDKILELMNG